MKKMRYMAPQVEVVRFETEEVLAEIISGSGMDETTPATGETPFSKNGSTYQMN